MTDPMPQGHWRAAWEHSRPEFCGLLRGQWYRVVRAFHDFDGDEHPVGETWVFLGHNFLPYHDGLSLFVSIDGHREWHIRLRWTAEDQGPIIDSLQEYLVPGDAN